MASDVDAPIARQISTRAVMQAIRADGPTSRADLAKRTGLSKQTISDVVRGLEEGGWLVPLGRTAGKPGRSAVTYEINGSAGLAAAIDLGGSKVDVAIADLRGEIVAETVEPTDARGGAHVVDQLARLLETLMDGLGRTAGDLVVIVLGVPGVLHPETGRITVAPNVPGLDRIDLRALLAERAGAPVIIENDVNLAARGEQWRGHGAGLEDFVFIALGTGIGMGIIANGQLLRGRNGAGGEIAYLPLGGDPFDPRGFRLGSFEDAVGSVAIAARYAGYGGAAGATVRDVFAALEQGEAAAVEAIGETARLLALGIAAVHAVLDADAVILGGSIGARPELLTAVRAVLPRCTPTPPRLELSALGSRAALVGAIGVAVARMHDDLFGVGLAATGFAPVREPGR